MSALSAVASFGNTAKAETNTGDIQDVTQTPSGTFIIKKDRSAEIGGVKTPWMFARPDGQSAFANHFTIRYNTIFYLKKEKVYYD